MYITVHHSRMYIGLTTFTKFSSVPYIEQLIVNNIAQPSSNIQSGFSPVRDGSSRSLLGFYFEETDIMLTSSKKSDVGIVASS